MRGASSSRSKILVLEDDRLARESLVRLFSVLGLDPVPASSMREAKAKLRQHSPAFGFVDYVLPDGDGIRLARWWKAEEPEARIALITGHDKLTVGHDACQAGIEVVLAKPFERPDLEGCLVKLQEAASRASIPQSADGALHEIVMRTLAAHGGNKASACRELSMSRGRLERILGAGPPAR